MRYSNVCDVFRLMVLNPIRLTIKHGFALFSRLGRLEWHRSYTGIVLILSTDANIGNVATGQQLHKGPSVGQVDSIEDGAVANDKRQRTKSWRVASIGILVTCLLARNTVRRDGQHGM